MHSMIISPKTFFYHSKKNYSLTKKPNFCYKANIKLTKKKSVCIPKSFASDILLDNLTYVDIFTISCVNNFIYYQLPCIFIYRSMNFTNYQISAFILFNAYLKTCLDLYIVTNP